MSDPAPNPTERPDDAFVTSDPISATPGWPPLQATQAGERYRVAQEIDHGGVGIVYHAIDTILSREVAVKVLHDKYAPDSGVARRFADEARITAQLQHPAIPPVHDIGALSDGRPFFAMKLIKGLTLDELLRARPDASAERGRFVAVFEQVCQAVAYAHAHGVLHRDLKPANVMVGPFGEVQLMDWGLAKVLHDPERNQSVSDPEATRPGTEVVTLRDSDALFTQAGSVLGTPAFMPPEQAAGVIERVDQRSDVFGLGAVLAVILTGKPPFAAASAESTRGLAALGDVADCFARLDACGADPELVALCKRCLSPKPEGRPADANEVAKVVAQLRAAADERARQAELDRVKAEGETAAAELRTAEQRKRRWIQAALGISFTALVVLAGTFAWWQDKQASERQAERLARQERTAVGVAETIHEAQERRQEAWELTDYPDRMQRATNAAVAAIGRADRLVAHGDATPETAANLAAARAEVEDLARHTQLLADASRILQQAGDSGFSVVEIPARFLAALRRFGFDPCNDPAADVVRRIVASRIRDNLLAMLLEMEFNITLYKPIPLGNLSNVIRSVRRQLGGPYARWQELLDRKDLPGLIEFARKPEALSLRAGVINGLGRDLSGESTQTTGNPEASRDLLRAAVARYPHDVWLHFDLALVCGQMNPPASAEALRHAAVLVLLRPESPGMRYILGKAYARLGDLDRAEDTFREAIQLDFSNSPAAHAALAELLERKGNLDEAIAAYQASLRLKPDEAATQAKLSRTQRMRELLPRLANVLAGKDKPKNPAEACEFAQLCKQSYQKRYADSVRLYADAFAADPQLAEERKASHRYNAACCAALAGCGKGADAPRAGNEKARLRGQALTWLRADLTRLRRQADSNDAAQRQDAAAQLSRWQKDADLTGVQSGPNQVPMPPEEETAWDKLWADVKEALALAQKAPTVTPGK